MNVTDYDNMADDYNGSSSKKIIIVQTMKILLI